VWADAGFRAAFLSHQVRRSQPHGGSGQSLSGLTGSGWSGPRLSALIAANMKFFRRNRAASQRSITHWPACGRPAITASRRSLSGKQTLRRGLKNRSRAGKGAEGREACPQLPAFGARAPYRFFSRLRSPAARLKSFSKVRWGRLSFISSSLWMKASRASSIGARLVSKISRQTA
jgi:hypothetical protein